MLPTRGYAVHSPTDNLAPFDFERRELSPTDVLITIDFCGVCHSDIHQVRGEWGNSIYPMVPGHEIVGRVTAVGAEVTKFKIGDHAGVGVAVDSCRECNNCRADYEQHCEKGSVGTYNSTEMDRVTPTYGGYSSQIVVQEHFALRITETENLAAVAPLLCAGITTYSPLKRFGIKAGQKVGVVGLGGLGHLGVKFAVSMGAQVTVFSTSPAKKDDATRLGAQHFVVSKNADEMTPLASTFDFILDTVSAPHDINVYLNLLRLNGAMVQVGIPEKPMEVAAFSLVVNNRSLAGSGAGGIAETQEMLDYCAEKGIVSDIEIIPMSRIAEAYDRTVKGDVRYRFVIDMSTL
ncbi:MAG: NAD(P)-dependent alcohol dehydrogenase [Armatimonadetes bacterium]|nr:NAD(P)-dependent alcohol dehydrogenase [Armatimonadota bacterium]